MTRTADPLNAIAVPAPQFSEAQALQTLQAEYGLQGKLLPLVSERDQNFRLTTTDAEQFVFKIANVSEPQIATDFQVEALLHLERQQCPVVTPRVQRTLAGAGATWIGADTDDPHRCRLVSFVPGALLSSVTITPALAAQLGHSAARLDVALSDFTHAGDSQVLLWDLQRASELRRIIDYVEDAELRDAVESCIDDFDTRVLPALPALRRQVIHADLNPDNVLATQAGSIAGFIDFGDMLRAPLVMEVAVAASYLRPGTASQDAVAAALAWICPLVAAYHAVLPLHDEELELLFDLLRARIAASITILRWRAAERGAQDAYSQQNLRVESSGAGILGGLSELGRDRFRLELKKAIKNR